MNATRKWTAPALTLLLMILTVKHLTRGGGEGETEGANGGTASRRLSRHVEHAVSRSSGASMGPSASCGRSTPAGLETVLDRCRTTFLAAGCAGPVRHPDGSVPIPRFESELTERILACGIPSESLHIDCTEYPCLAFARTSTEAQSAADCLGVSNPTQVDTLIGGFADVDAPPPNGAGSYILSRISWRATRVAAGISRHSAEPGWSDCEHTVDDPPCEEALEQMGCEPNPDLILTPAEVDEVLREVERTLDALSARCAVFAETSWFLDCEQLPCILGLPRGANDLNSTLCGDVIMHGVQFDTVGWEPDQMSLLPLLRVGSPRQQEVMEGRWSQDRRVRIGTLTSYAAAPLQPSETMHTSDPKS
jgi:hypothetical protein